MEAAEAVFSEKGYHDAAIDEIVRRTDMSKGGIYFHFPSKEKLFFAVVDHLGRRLIESIKSEILEVEDPIDRLKLALSTVLQTLGKRRRLAKLLLVQGYSMGNSFERKRVEIYSNFAMLIKDNLDIAVEQRSIPALDTEIASCLWVGALNEVVIRWIYTGQPSPISRALPVLTKMLLQGVGAQEESRNGG